MREKHNESSTIKLMLCLDVLMYYLNENEVKVANVKMIQGETTIQFFLNNCITKRTAPHLPVLTSKKRFMFMRTIISL